MEVVVICYMYFLPIILMGAQQMKSVSTTMVIFRAAVNSIFFCLEDSAICWESLMIRYMYPYAIRMKTNVQKLRPWNIATEYSHPGLWLYVMCNETHTPDLE